MELRHLRYFLSLADEPDLVKASKHAGIAPAVFWKHINDLEESLGCSLFRRHGEVITVSAAGRVFYERAKELLSAAAAAAGEARAAAENQGSRIRVGHYGLWWMRRYSGALRKFHHHRPSINLQPLEFSEAAIPGALRRGDIDIGLLEHVDVALRIELKVRRIEAMPASLIMAEGHPLAHRSRLGLHELASQTWVSWSESVFPGRRHLLLEAARTQGFHPCIAQEVGSEPELLAALADSHSIGCLPRLHREDHPEGFVIIPLVPSLVEFPVFLAWPKDAEELRPVEELAHQLLASSPHEKTA